ncbi:MAG TPA: hypothetical protein VLU41_08985 [Ideonella sp.]|nr:hypothetical protein [Ideonella sp.]
MRTTLDIEDDVLVAAKELARRQRRSAGAVLSELARRSLTGESAPVPGSRRRAVAVGGFRPFPARGVVVSDAAVDALRDAEGV